MTPNITTRLKKARRLRKNGDLKHALEVYQKLVRRAPDNPELHHELGALYLSIGQFQLAVGHCNRAIQLGLRSAEVFIANANAMNKLTHHGEAENMARAAVALAPNNPPALRTLIQSLLPQGKYTEALPYADMLLAQSPDNESDWVLVGWVHIALDKYGKAIAAGTKALEINPSTAGAYYLLSRVYKNIQRWEDAIEMADKALSAAPNNPEFIAMKADMLEHQGHYQQAFELVAPLVNGPSNHAALAIHVYARLARRYGKQERAVQLLEKLAADQANFVGMQHATLTLLGTTYDALGHYDKAFAAIDRANKQRPSKYDAGELENYTRAITSYFTAERLQNPVVATQNQPGPIFIVGMPRSGTSLTEKILSRHPQVHAGGETIHLPALLHKELPELLGSAKAFPACLEELTPEVADQAAAIYLQKLLANADSSISRVTEKRPMNFMYLGAIAQIFPHAKIINCTRDPLDIGLSCYFANFASASEMGFSQNLEHIGQYYNCYEEMLAHWHQVLNMPILDLAYESLVSEPEAEISRLLEFCDLPWHEDCLSPQKSKQVTMTASYDQVRKPINTDSIGRWKLYDKHLTPLKVALGQTDSQAA